MSIYIYTNQQPCGPYEENVVRAWLQTGQISPEVLACRQGATEWQPVRDLFYIPTQDTASAQTGTCEKCRRHEGNVYSFYYGTKVRGSTRMVSLTSNKYVTSYQMAGRKDVAVCDACLQRRSISKIVFFGFMIAVGVLTAFGGLIKAQTFGPPFLLCMGLPAFIFILLGSLGLKDNLSKKNAYDAERIAIALKKGELQRQGFDTFWSSAKYRMSQRQTERYRRTS